MGRPSGRIASGRVSGPLAGYAAAFHATLVDARYAPRSALNQLRLMAHLSRWLDAEGLTAADLDSERVDQYLTLRRTAGASQLVTRRALAPLLGLLAAHQALPAQRRPAAPVGAEALLDGFERYLLGERGLTSLVARAYRTQAGRLLEACAPNGQVAQMTAAQVSGALVAECTALSVASAQQLGVALRAFLHFCHREGLIEADLSAAALAVTGRRHSLLPKGIGQADAAALLRCCDPRRAVGRRDHAVIVLCLRLGLRAGEVAALRLDDIDWRIGAILVRGKGSRQERLPLPVDVGEAIAAYLRRGRPSSSCRELFLSAVAPVSGLGRGGVSAIVRRACRRAGLAPIGAHRLRHTMACEMMRAGAPLAEIGQVLRHRDLATTAIYARVDVEQLREIARAWPEGS